MQMTKGEAICQEFCEQVEVGHTIRPATALSLNDLPLEFKSVEELKCRLNIEHFTGLVERMVQAGYCCTQVQKDLGRSKCTAWFEPMSLEEIV